VLVVPALILGVLVTAQWQTTARRPATTGRYQVELTDAALALQGEQGRLKSEVARLRTELDALHAQGAARDARLGDLQQRIDALKDDAGLDVRTGAGVVLTLDDARLPPTTARRAIELGIVHSQDIVDVLNAGWRAGAEAIAINGERITGASACVGATIQINGTLMSPPFAVSMLGPPDQMYRALADPKELAQLKQRSTAFGLGFALERAGQVRIPAYTGPLLVRHAKLVG
jgi:uncharacterized protein YlxW (UPF0749 family)